MPLDISRIRVLCFDIDGTLNDTDDQFVERVERVLKVFRFLLLEQDQHKASRRLVMWLEKPGNFVYGLPDRLGLDDDFSKIITWLHNQNLISRSTDFKIIPGSLETLDKLAQHFLLAVVTARDAYRTHAYVESLGIDRLFECVAHAQTCPRTKPFPDPILWVASKVGVAPRSCVMVGDTNIDMRAGKAAGAQTVGVLSGFGEREELQEAGADLILKSVAGLLEILLSVQLPKLN
ncbi:MAG: HAD family hydrolase [Chloroflexi bacterium]|nr:HAD family hydrolase [Chloroflexota bacterium]